MTREQALGALADIRAQTDALEAFLAGLAANEPAPAAEAPPAPPQPPGSLSGLQKPAAFYDALRGELWPRLTPAIVDGIEATLRVAGGRLPTAWTAYCLATEYHETAYTMQAIKERGSAAYLDKYDTGRLAAALGNTPEDDDDGIRLAGRGKVQITGARNYKFSNKRLHELGFLKAGEDLFENPDLALRPDVAAAILVFGMLEGWFTGKRLNDYINNSPTLQQFTNARRIVNGLDRAADIAGYAMKFLAALQAGEWK